MKITEMGEIEKVCRMIKFGGIKLRDRVYFTEFNEYAPWGCHYDDLPIMIFYDIDKKQFFAYCCRAKIDIAQHIIETIKAGIEIDADEER